MFLMRFGNRFCKLLLLALVSSTLFGQLKRAPLTSEQIARANSPTVVVVRTANWAKNPLALGSGVIIDTGAIVTNYHVLENACDVSVQFLGRERAIPVDSLVAVDRSRDLAILGVAVGKNIPARFGVSRDLRPGARVTVIGNPEGLGWTVSEGVIAGIRESKGSRWIQITAPISHGSSGGAVFDYHGDLIGITTASIQEGQNLNFAIPVEEVQRLWQGSQDGDWVDFIPWSQFSADSCKQKTSEIDASLLRHLIGKSLAASEVQQLLLRLGGGTLPPSTTEVRKAIQSGNLYLPPSESRDFHAGSVSLEFVAEKLYDVFLYTDFRGVLPLGLRWGMSRAEVESALGKPRSINDRLNDVWVYSYESSGYEHNLFFFKTDRLAGMQISAAL